jgi:predicted transcriptional regulator
MTSIANHLLGQTRSAVLGTLLLHPEDSLHVHELARRTGASAGSLHRELRSLAEMGVLLAYKPLPKRRLFETIARATAPAEGSAA